MFKKFAVTIALLSLITGCGEDKSVESNESNSKNSIETSQNNDTKNIVDNDQNNDTKSEDKKTETVDEKVLNYVKDAYNKADEFFNSQKLDDLKAAGKKYFIEFVDFIFYNGDIKGVTFNELKDTTKQEIVDLANKIDVLVMKKFPNYKESIMNEAHNVTDILKTWMIKGSESVKDFVTDQIGQDELDEAISKAQEIIENDKQTVNDIKDKANEIISKNKEKINDWYQNYKES